MCTWFGGGGNLFMMLPMLLFMGVIVWGFITVVRKIAGTNCSNQPADNSKQALEILKERYAKGEITQEEFTKMKADIV